MRTKKAGILFSLLLVMLLMFSTVAGAATVKKKIGYKKNTVEFTVSLKGKWTATSNKTWATVKKKKGKITVTVKANTGTKERTAKITVKNKKNETVVYKVTQIAKVVKPANPTTPQKIVVAGFKYDWTLCKRPDVTKEFLEKVVVLAKKLGVTPDDLMTVMAFESSLDHTIVNPNSNATGLIQFLPSTAQNLGTTVAKLKKMTAVKQLDYVYKYLSQAGTLRNLGDLYMAILWPQGVGQKDSFVLWKKGTPEYKRNSALDVNKDKKVTRGECLARVLANRVGFVGE